MYRKHKMATCISVALLLLALPWAGIATTDEPRMGEGKTLQIICPPNVQMYPEGSDANNNLVVNRWREVTGFDFDIVNLPMDGGKEKLNLMFSSGECKGWIWVGSMENVRSYVEQLANQEYLAPLDNYMADSKLFQAYADRQYQGNFNGKQYAWVTPVDTSTSGGVALVARTDLLSEAGIGNQPKTLQELESQLNLFQERGMTPFAGRGSVGDGWVGVDFQIFRSYFTVSNTTAVRDDKVVYPMLTADGKEYLAYMKKLYDDGIIPQDYQVLSGDDTLQLFLSGKAGFLSTGAPWTIKNWWADAEAAGYAPKLVDFPQNKLGVKGASYPNNLMAGCFGVISADCENPEDYIKFFDEVYFNEDLRRFTYYGEEGVHYTMEDGQIKLTDRVGEIAFGSYFRIFYDPLEWYNLIAVADGHAEFFYGTQRTAVGSPDYDPLRTIAMPAEYMQGLTKLTNEILNPYCDKVVIGEASLDDFEKMVEEFMDAGGADLLNQAQKAWDDSGRPVSIVEPIIPDQHEAFTGAYMW